MSRIPTPSPWPVLIAMLVFYLAHRAVLLVWRFLGWLTDPEHYRGLGVVWRMIVAEWKEEKP